MKKAITLPANAGETTTATPGNGAVDYCIKPGVEWINGARVCGAQSVALTTQEAAYDLSLGRISPASEPVPKDWPAAPVDAGAGDGRD